MFNLVTLVCGAERLLAAQNPLSHADRPHQLFADAPPAGGVPVPVPMMAPPPPPGQPVNVPPPITMMPPPINVPPPACKCVASCAAYCSYSDAV